MQKETNFFNRDQKTYIAIPGGEWQDSLLRILTQTSIKLNRSSPRNYRIDLPSLNLVLIIARSKDVPDLVTTDSSKAVAGITGTDILIEKSQRSLTSITKKQNSDWLIPVDDQAPKPTVYFGFTPNAYDKFGQQASLEQVLTGLVISAYPILAQQYLTTKGMSAEIQYQAGKIEGLWQLLSNCYAVCDISSTGATREANQISLWESILQVQLVLFLNQDKLTNPDQQRINNLKEVLSNNSN